MSLTGKIFIVDDNLTSLELIKIVLEQEGYTIKTSFAPTTAVEKIIDFQPDLVLLDIIMPEMDGFEVCAQLKNNERSKDIPIIFLSATDNTKKIVKGFQSGAVDYITKPFEQRELLARVNTHIKMAVLKKEQEIQADSLLQYTRQLENEIALRKKLERELKNAQQITHIGSWYLDLGTNEVNWSEELYKMYGFDPMLPPPPYNEHTKLFTPESWEQLSSSIASTVATGIPYELELKTLRKDGTNGWMWVRGETVKDNEGNTIGLWGAVQDISERKKTEELLQQKNEEIRSQNEEFMQLNEELDQTNRELLTAKNKTEENEHLLIESQRVAHLGSYVWNLFSNQWDSSEVLDEIFGIDENYERSLNGWIKIIHPSWQTTMNDYVTNEVVLKQQRFDKEYQIIRQNDGQVRWVHGLGELKFDDRHQPTALIGTIQDITERKLAEDEIKNKQNLLRTLIDHIPDNIYIKDTQARKVILNKADMKFFDLEKNSQIIGKTDLELIPGKFGERGYNDDMAVLTTGIPIINREEDFIMPTGEHRWFLTTKLPLVNQNKEIYGLVGIGREITDLKASNEYILKLSAAIEQSPLSIVITNIKGEIEFTNPKFTEITGYSGIEVKGQNPRILKSGETPLKVYRDMWKTIAKGKEWHGEFHNQKKNGELYWESATIAPIIDEKGKIISYIAIKEDITSQKQLFEELIESKAKAVESDHLKSAFLANMSHEIRTPLNGILGFTELLVDPEFDQHQKDEMSKIILDNGDLLLSIINDILDISKIEAGLMEIHLSTFKVENLIKNTVNSFMPKARKQGLELIVVGNQKNCAKQITSDFIRAKQILTNLVSNALKYTENGYVEIGCTQDEREIIFYVKDTGAGIAAKNLEQIFDRFNRRDAYTKKVSGTGLGLAISKSFVEMLGGRIWVESEVGKGSTFYFGLPL